MTFVSRTPNNLWQMAEAKKEQRKIRSINITHIPIIWLGWEINRNSSYFPKNIRWFFFLWHWIKYPSLAFHSQNFFNFPQPKKKHMRIMNLTWHSVQSFSLRNGQMFSMLTSLHVVIKQRTSKEKKGGKKVAPKIVSYFCFRKIWSAKDKINKKMHRKGTKLNDFNFLAFKITMIKDLWIFYRKTH